jgi:hypothetical protein
MAITEEPPLELLEIQDWFRNVVRKTSLELLRSPRQRRPL